MMAFNNVPANGWPQIKDLEKLAAIAKQIENMPTFTSDDRAFLSDLPSYPSSDGTKVLTATTTSGETSLSYEEIENELPSNPQADGTKVLTATTTSGETVLSWETPQTNIVNYSATEQATGQKWIDGKDIYTKTIDCGTLPNNTTKEITHGISSLGTIVKIEGVATNTSGNVSLSLPLVYESTNAALNTRISVDSTKIYICTTADRSSYDSSYVTLYYTKATT